MQDQVLEIDHPRFHKVLAAVFTKQIVGDCMSHSCRMVDRPDRPDVWLDACCQYGCDVDLAERAAIEQRAPQIRSLLRASVADQRWFELDEWEDADYPSGRVVRSEVAEGGCIFLAHDKRGCAIHRAAIEQGWDYREAKPMICRLYPLSYEGELIMIAEEYAEYSCAFTGGPTVYRAARDALRDAFGPELIVQLDAAEAKVLGSLAAAPRPPEPHRLPVL